MERTYSPMILPEHLPHRAMSLILAICFCQAASVPARADEPLQGQVEQADVVPSTDAPPPAMEPMPVPVVGPKLKKPLQGKLEQSGLQGGAQGTGLTGGAQGTGLTGGAEDSAWNGNSQQATMDQSRQGQLQGSNSQARAALNAANDPDAGDQELQIEWDRWRNTLMQTIQAGTVQKINVHNDINFIWDPRQQMMVIRYPMGTSTWYSCDVLPDRRIINIKLLGSSGYQGYDQAVLQAISALQGNSILRYPQGSKRKIVNQQASVSTAGASQNQNFQFGDVERQRY